MSSIEIPGYKIIKTLGVGGQATVYLAIQEGFDREVALKVMSPALAADPSFGERFIREAKIVAKLRHPNIVTVYDVGEHDGFFYLAMEYMPGIELRKRVAANIKAKDALIIIAKISRALDYAHQKGYIHRDVKSDNILFRDDDEPILTDFGIAKASNSSTQMTQQGKLIGTPQYMSPEQCRGRKLDGRSDIYSLGVILFEMLTQAVPYDGEDSVAVCLMHVTKPIPKLPVRLQHYQWLLDRMLAKKMEDRFATGTELAIEIEQFLSGETVKQDRPDIRASRHDDDTLIVPLDESFATEERMAIHQKSSSKKWPWFLLVLIVVGALGYTQQAKWMPIAQKVWTEFLGDKPSEKAVASLEVPSNVEDSSAKAKPVQTQQSEESLGIEEQAKRKHIAELMIEANSLARLSEMDAHQARELLQAFARVLAIEPQHTQATEGRNKAIALVKNKAVDALTNNEEVIFQQYRSVMESFAKDELAYAELEQAFQEYSATKKNAEKALANANEIKRLIREAESAFAANRLSTPRKNNAFELFHQVLQIDPSNNEALDGIERVKTTYVKTAQKALLEKQMAEANSAIERLSVLDPNYAALGDLQQQYATINQIVESEKKAAAEQEKVRQQKLEQERILADPLTQLKLSSKLQAARLAFSEGQLVEPEEFSALAKYKEMLAIDPNHKEALDGVKLVKEKLVTLVKEAIQNSDESAAKSLLSKLNSHFKNAEESPLLQQQINEMSLILPLEQDNQSADEADLPIDSMNEENLIGNESEQPVSNNSDSEQAQEQPENTDNDQQNDPQKEPVEPDPIPNS